MTTDRTPATGGLLIPATAKLRPGELIRVLEGGWELVDDDGLRDRVTALAEEIDAPQHPRCTRINCADCVGRDLAVRLRGALAASPAPASRPEAEHSHETGGAWHVTRWRVPGCPACGDPSPASRPEAAVKVTADVLDQWTEDALTQGEQPSTYIYQVLAASLRPRGGWQR